MKSKGCFRWSVLLGIVALVVLCVAALALLYFQANNRALESRPLVLIHAPLNREPFRVGERIIVHATARQNNGLRRVELWVNDTFVDARDAPEGSAPTSLVFSGSWAARNAGNHVFIVRAIASDGTEGQASIVTETLPRQGADAGIHTVEAGETLEIIAEEYGLAPDELASANPGLDSGGFSPGDELVIPDGEATSGEASPPAEPPADSEPPLPEGIAPGADFDFSLFAPLQAYPFGADEPTRLRVEFLGLTTAASYEHLYCYVSYADVSPHRYPDRLGGESTDESFDIITSETDGSTTWNIAELSGNTMPAFDWPRNLDLPLRVSCLGIIDGGTDSVELGHWESSIAPEYWTGMTLEGGVAGSYEFAFRISPPEGGGRGVPLYLDIDMTPPSNARLDDRRISLRWDYEPRPDEEPIDGFRIYLNGSQQWVESADSRESMLPYEWFNPPCGVTYVFSVTAYRVGIPDGPESFPAIVTLEQPAENCQREILITFLTLETFDLGGDGDRPPHHGNVGPVYGRFFANERQITFDTRAPGSGGWLDMPNGLSHNTLYNLIEMSAEPTWHFNGMPALLVDIPDNGAFEFGFHIMDEDSGRCRNSSDPGCDDLVCEGLSALYQVDSGMSWIFDLQNEGVLVSEDGRCRVTYRWGPAFGSPVGSGVEGWEPLPWIHLEDFVVNEDTGLAQIHVRNTGPATWPWRDLKIELQSRDGLSLGVYTWPAFVLESGQRAVLEHPDMRLGPPFDACVLIDPDDEVLEEYERSGAMAHSPICPPIPDLVITDVHYLPGGGSGQVSVTISNVGEGALENRAVSIQTYQPDGTPLYIGGSYPNITLGRYQTRTLNFGGVSDFIREQMRAGYRVTVNPDERIFERNMDNNTFDIPAANNLMIRVMSVSAPWDYRNSSDFRLTVYATSGSAQRETANLYFSDLDWSACTRDNGCYYIFEPGDRDNFTYWFPLFGDESLEVVARSTHRGGDWTVSESYLPSDNWEANGWGSRRSCNDWNSGTPGWHRWVFNRHEGHPLNITFQVCQENP